MGHYFGHRLVLGLAIAFAMIQTATSQSGFAAEAQPVQLESGDRVVFIGSTLIEREQLSGLWESMLTAAQPSADIVFRNLGWSGDTVWAESRGIFDPPAKGYERLLELVRELHPTVLILGYGSVEAYDGPQRLDAFVTQYRKLLDDLKQTGDVRVVLLSPPRIEITSAPTDVLFDAETFLTRQNQNVVLYSDAIAKLAAEQGHAFIDLRSSSSVPNWPKTALTENGIHFSPRGYWATGRILVEHLTDASPESIVRTPWSDRATHSDWGTFSALTSTVRTKNELFFHRWRPQNFTYLFGFRKHEQGQNAVEVTQFDPLIDAQEKAIRRHRAALGASSADSSTN